MLIQKSHISVSLLLFGLLTGCSKQNTLDDSGSSVTGRVVQGNHFLASANVRAYGAATSALQLKSAPRQGIALSTNPSLDDLSLLLDTTSTQPDGSYTLSIGSHTGPLRIEVTQNDPGAFVLSALIIATPENAQETLVTNVNELTTLAERMFSAKYGSSQPITAVGVGIAETATKQLFHLPAYGSASLSQLDVATRDDPTTVATRDAQMLSVVTSSLNTLSMQGLSIDSIAKDAGNGKLEASTVTQLDTTLTAAVAEAGLDDSGSVPRASSSVAFVGPFSGVSTPVYSVSSDATLGLDINFPPMDEAATYAILLSNGTCADPGAALDTQTALVANADDSAVDYTFATGLTPDAPYCLSISAQSDDDAQGMTYTVDLTATAP